MKVKPNGSWEMYPFFTKISIGKGALAADFMVTPKVQSVRAKLYIYIYIYIYI